MCRHLRTTLLLVLAIVLGTYAPAFAADPVQIRITGIDAGDYPNVRLTASITDAAGNPLANLDPKDILISEDGRTQRASASPIDEQRPVALVLALDVSGSMSGKPLADAKAALQDLVRSLRPADSAALVTFEARVSVVQQLTTDKTALLSAIDRTVASGNTAIFDGANTAIDLLVNADPRARRAIVLLTDGVDNSSRATLADIAQRMKDQAYPMYVVGLGSNLDTGVLRSLASAGTGGAMFIAPTSAQLASIYATLAQEIRVQYSLSYRSDATRASEGAQVTLTVQVVSAGAPRGATTVSFTVPAGRGIATATPTAELTAPPAPAAPAESRRVDPLVLSMLGSASVLALGLFISSLLETRDLARLERERLARYSGDGMAREPSRRSLWTRAVRPSLLRVVAPFGRLAPQRMVDGTRRRLAQSGNALDITAAEFIGLRLGLAVVLAVLSTVVAYALDPVAMFAGLVGLSGALAGVLVPAVWLDRTVRARQHRILRALPSALDMLALSASAGMTLDGAVGQVAQRWPGPLSDEFRRLLVEFNVGRDRRAALRGLGERTGVPEVGRFANAIIQADSLGTPISRVLQEQAVEMRTRRRQRAEEAARKAPVKMLFPMVGLIFPSLFVVILGPAVPRFMDLFGQVH